MTQTKYKIGEFSRLGRVTVRTLRHYEKIGLLKPEIVGMHLVSVVAPEMARLGCECPEPGYCFTIETAKEYKAENFEIEYCEQVTSAGKDSDIVKFKTLPEYPTAICMKVYGPYGKLRESYLELFSEIAKMSYTIVDAPRACYVDGIWNQEDPEKWLTIIQVPVQKAE